MWTDSNRVPTGNVMSCKTLTIDQVKTKHCLLMLQFFTIHNSSISRDLFGCLSESSQFFANFPIHLLCLLIVASFFTVRSSTSSYWLLFHTRWPVHCIYLIAGVSFQTSLCGGLSPVFNDTIHGTVGHCKGYVNWLFCQSTWPYWDGTDFSLYQWLSNRQLFLV